MESIVQKNIKFVALSMFPYLFVQIPAFFSGCSTGDGSKCDSHYIHWICLACFVISFELLKWGEMVGVVESEIV